MVAIWVFAFGAVCAVVDWIAVARGAKRLEYVFKPATLIAVLAGAVLLTAGPHVPHIARWFIPALAFSLAGDIFLMLPGERWFLPGLAAFLLAQVGYIVGLNLTLPPPASLWLLVPIVVLDALVLSRVVAGAVRAGAAALRVPIVAYGVILSLTLFSGWATFFRPSWPLPARVAASAGATLFFASDLMLAWDRFVARSRLMHVLVIITYHLAQFALALTIALAAF